MDQDLFSGDYRKKRGKPPKDNLFGWTVFILLMIGFTFACWIGTYYIFSRPENPKSYEILKKLKKVEPPKRFELTQAPQGEFLNAQKLFDRYATMSRLDLEKENASLIRAYLRNYDATKQLVPYVVGRYTVVAVYDLTPADMFPTGVVAIAQSADQPQVLIEHVFSAPVEVVPSLKKMLQPGLDIRLEKTLDLSAVIQVNRVETGHLQFTCVPLLYGSYRLGQGSGRFSLEPPADLNMAGGAPIVDGQQLQEALKLAAQNQAKARAPRIAANNPNATPTPGPELVRLETPTPAPVQTPAPAATPGLAVATPPPATRPSPSPTSSPLVVAVNTTPTPVPEPRRSPSPTPSPTPALAAVSPTPSPTAAGNVPLQPFLTAVATPSTTTTAASSWRTYDPGRMPLGKLVDVQDAADLAERGVGGEIVYLRGDFSVSAARENRAVLRPKAGAISNVLGRAGTRVIVEFPAGMTPPAERSTITRDQQRPFQITDVRKGEDGSLNIYVREITRPQ